jgi:exodeoxyribonuclease V gamma subunit
VPVERLAEFFRHPSGFLLRHRLGVELARPEELLDDDEPLFPDYPQRTALAARLLPRALAGMPGAALKTLALAGIEYPGGALGEQQIDVEVAMLHDYAARVRADSADAPLPPCRLDAAVQVDGVTWRVHGEHADLRRGGLLRHRYADSMPGDYLTGWLHHLLLCAAGPADAARATRWHSRNGTFAFAPVDDPGIHLAELLRLYERGLREPLHFFPKSSLEFVRTDRNLQRAEAKWKFTAIRRHTEGADPAHRLALRGVADPLDAEFEACAGIVFEPLLQHLEDARL